MKKRTFISLFLVVAMLLCACGAEPNTVEQANENVEYYYRADAKSVYPLGIDGSITGVAADSEHIFVCGTKNDVPALAVMGYTMGTESHSLSDADIITTLGEEDRAINVSYGAGKFYFLVGTSDESADSETYAVRIYRPDGAEIAVTPLKADAHDAPKTILPLDDGSFWLICLHGAYHYSEEGAEIECYSSDRLDFEPALNIGGNVVFHATDYQSGKSRLYSFYSDTCSLEPVDADYDISSPTAICQSAIGVPLINMGSSLCAADSNIGVSPVADWSELLGATTQYRYVCQLDDNTFLLVPRDIDEIYYQMQGIKHGASGELVCLTADYVPDERNTVRIAFYGSASDLLLTLKEQYAHSSPDYRVECLDYGSDEDGLTKLMRDVAVNDTIDIVVCDGYSLDYSSGFVDLYPFIDNDSELSRDDFVPQVLAGIERNGELNAIWSTFSINTFVAFDALTENPNTLTLADCQEYLDALGYSEPLFSDWMTNTELLECLAPGILKSAYDSESNSYDLNNANTRTLLELCRNRPTEENPDNPYFSELLVYTDLQPDYLDNLIENRSFRLFDGSDGGENFTSLFCGGHSMHLIPKTCADKENAWGFLHLMLTEEWQIRDFNQRRICYPGNIHALEAVLESYNSPRMTENLHGLIDSATRHTHNYNKIEQVFIESVLPYIYGDMDPDTVLDIAESKMRIIAAEQE